MTDCQICNMNKIEERGIGFHQFPLMGAICSMCVKTIVVHYLKYGQDWEHKNIIQAYKESAERADSDGYTKVSK